VAEREEPVEGPEDAESGRPLDEEAAWAQIVAGYGEEPEVGPDGWPDEEERPEPQPSIPVLPRHFVVRVPEPGPRDYELADDGDEGHFEPPEPPPLPSADVTTKFAWLAVLGGPLLVLAFVLFQQPLPWWAVVLGVGGFLGGFATLIARMKDRDEDDDPHGGAVV
jgi:hypothetical protein